MLYDIVLSGPINGSVTQEEYDGYIDEAGKWEIKSDDYGNNYYVKENIKKRIRISKDLSFNPNLERAVPPEVFTSGVVNLYETPSSARWVNNNKNMNPTLTVGKDNDQMIVYLTVLARGYRVIDFSTRHRILQTYRQKGEYQGCAIVLNKSDLLKNEKERDNEVFRLVVRNKKSERFEVISLTLNLATNELEIINKEDISEYKPARLYAVEKKFAEGVLFRVRVKKNDFLTNTYFVSPEKEAETKELVSGIKNANVVVLTPNMLENVDTLRAVLKEELEAKKVRAFTTNGVRIPNELVKEFKQLYIFDYDSEKGYIKCVKSN